MFSRELLKLTLILFFIITINNMTYTYIVAISCGILIKLNSYIDTNYMCYSLRDVGVSGQETKRLATELSQLTRLESLT